MQLNHLNVAWVRTLLLFRIGLAVAEVAITSAPNALISTIFWFPALAQGTVVLADHIAIVHCNRDFSERCY